MYVGHYAIGIGLAALRPRRGAPTYLALAAIFPDLPAAVMQVMGAPVGWAMTHGLVGLSAAALAMFAIGAVALTPAHGLLAVLCVGSHAVLDAYTQWLYAHRWLDLVLELGVLACSAALLFARSSFYDVGAKRRGVAVCVLVGMLQVAWDVAILS